MHNIGDLAHTTHRVFDEHRFELNHNNSICLLLLLLLFIIISEQTYASAPFVIAPNASVMPVRTVEGLEL
jgi:hypothetical protein